MARQRPQRGQGGMPPIDPAMQGMLRNLTQEMDKALRSSDAFAAANKKLAEANRNLGLSFAGVTAALTGWTRAGLAGTTTGEQLAWSTKMLAQQITALFLPAIEKGIDRLQKITDWFRSLSGEQQNQIARWTGLGVALMGSLVIVPRLQAAFGGLATSLALLVRNNPLTVLTASVTALMAQSEEGRDALSDLGKSMMDAFQPLAELLQDILLPVLQGLADFMATGFGQATALTAIVLLSLQRIILAVTGLRVAFLGVGGAIAVAIGLVAALVMGLQKSSEQSADIIAAQQTAKAVRSGRTTVEGGRAEIEKQIKEREFALEEWLKGNLPLLKGPGTLMDIARAMKMREEGRSPAEIAEELNRGFAEKARAGVERAAQGAPPHRDMTLARVGTEDAVATIRRLESSVLKTDYAKRTADAAEGTEKGVNWFKDFFGKAFGKGTKLEADPKMDD